MSNQVASGKYALSEEVVLAALQTFAERNRIYKGRFEELQQEIAIGVEASLREEVIDGETLFSHLQQKIQQRREQAY
ncbi:type II toxin-antitoxin system ParD family antitoxin [Scytonema sp. UIC 10036]|nr:type II toxin-antitoxin system ParD family antitoxin [Scytonema sp. UIC 10036]